MIYRKHICERIMLYCFPDITGKQKKLHNNPSHYWSIMRKLRLMRATFVDQEILNPLNQDKNVHLGTSGVKGCFFPETIVILWILLLSSNVFLIQESVYIKKCT